MNHGKNDVRPSVANKGLVERSQFKGDIPERERAKEQERQSQVVQKHLTKMDSYESRDIFTETDNGLPIVGPASMDCNSVVGLVHNAAMAAVDAQIAALTARIAALESAKK